MRFNNYLNEQITDLDEVVSRIKKDCRQYLRESKNGVLFRGSGKEIDGLMTSITPRQDRRPLDTPKPWHEWADKYFLDKFGWKARSQGVFTTPSEDKAQVYGNAYIFYPIGDFKYLWSPRIEDFTLDIARRGKKPTKKGFFTRFKKKDKPEKLEITEEIMELMNSYTDKGLATGIRAHRRSEFIFKCKKYYVVQNRILEDLKWLLK